MRLLRRLSSAQPRCQASLAAATGIAITVRANRRPSSGRHRRASGTGGRILGCGTIRSHIRVSVRHSLPRRSAARATPPTAGQITAASPHSRIPSSFGQHVVPDSDHHRGDPPSAKRGETPAPAGEARGAGSAAVEHILGPVPPAAHVAGDAMTWKPARQKPSNAVKRSQNRASVAVARSPTRVADQRAVNGGIVTANT